MTLLLDILGLAFAAFLAGIVIWGFRHLPKKGRPDFQFLANPGIVGVVAVLGLLLTYGTVRTQQQQTADNAFNVTGGTFVEAEYRQPLFRCLYRWSAHDRPTECLDKIVSDGDNYTEVMLYIEEVFYILESANRDKSLWRSRYADDIEYWREDVAEDPTGMFSYQIVVENPTDVVGAMKRSGVKIELDRLCRNYRNVHRQLVVRGGTPNPLVECEA